VESQSLAKREKDKYFTKPKKKANAKFQNDEKINSK